MSRSSAKKHSLWSAVVREAAERAGFEATRYAMVGDSFSLGREIAPSVEVFFERVTFAETAPQAFLGIYSERFEGEWRDRLARSGSPTSGESPALGLHVANVASLLPRPWVPFSPSEHELASLQEWLDRLFAYAAQLPSGVAALAAAVEANEILERKAASYLGHPVKVRGFFQWLRRAYGVRVGDNLLPLLNDRTEPYDVEAMLREP